MTASRQRLGHSADAVVEKLQVFGAGEPREGRALLR